MAVNIPNSNPRIIRKEHPPKMAGRDGYQAAREYLRRDFENRCAYCMIHESQAGGEEHFWIDHFKPQNIGGAINDYENLYWSCIGCNRLKWGRWPKPEEDAQGYRFADPCKEQDYGVHFVENKQAYLIWHDPCGEYHVLRLRLNRTSRKTKRIQRNELRDKLQEAINQAEQKRSELKMASQAEIDLLNQIIDRLSSEVQAVQRDLAICIPFIPAPDIAET